MATQRFAAEAAFLDACCASPGLSVALVSTSTEQEEQTVLARGVLHGLEEIFETGAVDRACSLTFLDVPAEEDEGSVPRPPLELQLQIAAYEAATYEPPAPPPEQEEQEDGAHQKINTNKSYLPMSAGPAMVSGIGKKFWAALREGSPLRDGPIRKGLQ